MFEVKKKKRKKKKTERKRVGAKKDKQNLAKIQTK